MKILSEMISRKNNNIFFVFLIYSILMHVEGKKINNINAINKDGINNNKDYLNKIIAKTSNNNQQIQSNDLRKKIVNFINNIIPVGTKTLCNNRLLQSDVQAEMKRLRSFLSTCSRYCRLAMNENGLLYGASEFNLDAIWVREDVSDESLFNNLNLLGAHYIKFVLSNKYLCIKQDGQLYASDNQDNRDCLWLNTWPKLYSANYNLNINLKNICQNFDKPVNMKNMRNSYNEYSKFEEKNDLCTDNLNITSGYSSDLQKFFSNCQSILLKQSYSIPNYSDNISNQYVQTTFATQKTTKENFNLFKPIFNKILSSSLPPTTIATTNKLKQDKSTSINNDDLKSLCNEYLFDELVYKASFSNQQPVEYYYETQYLEKKNKKTVPKLCSDLIAQLDNTNQIEDTSRYQNNNNQLYSSENSSNKFKKCFKYRNTPEYLKCMNRHYKCYQYSNDIEKLKKCRKANGITVATKTKTIK